MSKSIVSILIGIAIDRAIEALTKKLYFCRVQEGENYNQYVTIKHLLTMSSGMKAGRHYNPFSIPAESYFTKELEKLMFKLIYRKPGEKWTYQSGNTQLMGIIGSLYRKKTERICSKNFGFRCKQQTMQNDGR